MIFFWDLYVREDEAYFMQVKEKDPKILELQALYESKTKFKSGNPGIKNLSKKELFIMSRRKDSLLLGSGPTSHPKIIL